MKLLWVVSLAFGLAGLAIPAQAENTAVAHKLSPRELRDDALDSLFAQLQRARGEDESQLAERKIWEMWSQSDSVTADVLLKQAVVAMDTGDNRSSFSILNQLIATYPSYAEAWNKRATLNFMIGRYNDSLADIDKVLELEPRHFGALAGRGMIYRAQEKWGDALDAFRQAIRINPNMTAVKDAIRDLEKREPSL
jgi:tetratricopeptide (TPR) repeat protein